jgi:hypothetical protein
MLQQHEEAMINDDAVIRLLSEIRDNQLEDITLRRMAIDDSRKAIEVNRRFQTIAMRRVRFLMVTWVATLIIGLPIIAGAVWLILNARTIARSVADPPGSACPAP